MATGRQREPRKPSPSKPAMATGRRRPPKKPPSRKSTFGIKIIVLLVVVLLAFGTAGAGGLVIWAQNNYAAPGPLTGNRSVIIQRGMSTKQISNRLALEGVIDSPMIFRWSVRWFGGSSSFKAGEYQFSTGISMRDVGRMLTRGETLLRRFTVAEGLTAHEIFRIVRGAEGLEGAITIQPEEGRYLPETYYYSRGDTRDQVVQRMRSSMDKVLDELWRNRAPNLPLKSKEEALVLASIIEKETSVDAERELIAGVFINRLRKGMRLQTDPTVIYGITKGRGTLGRRIRQSELKKPTPYNTYVIKGLPPGPIASPGRDSIAAALNPANTKYLYFVADGSGGHAFAKTGREHERNVAKWRKIQRQRSNGG